MDVMTFSPTTLLTCWLFWILHGCCLTKESCGSWLLWSLGKYNTTIWLVSMAWTSPGDCSSSGGLISMSWTSWGAFYCHVIHSATRLIELANKCLNGVSSLKSLLSTAKKMPMVLVANASTHTSECSRRVTQYLWVDDTASRVANLTFYQST